jgi:hypothetical protein
VFVRALGDAVRNALLDVKFEDDMADAPNRRFRRRQLLQNRDTETGLLDHLANAAELPFDALQPREDVALMLDVQRGRARPARGIDYSMRIQSGSCGLFVGHLKRLTAGVAGLFTRLRASRYVGQAESGVPPLRPGGFVKVSALPVDDDDHRKCIYFEGVQRLGP